MSSDNNFASYANLRAAVGYQNPPFDSRAQKTFSRGSHLQASFSNSDQYNFVIGIKSYLLCANGQRFTIDSHFLFNHRVGLDRSQGSKEYTFCDFF